MRRITPREAAGAVGGEKIWILDSRNWPHGPRYCSSDYVSDVAHVVHI
jgi:hypothetical protein